MLLIFIPKIVFTEGLQSHPSRFESYIFKKIKDQLLFETINLWTWLFVRLSDATFLDLPIDLSANQHMKFLN